MRMRYSTLSIPLVILMLTPLLPLVHVRADSLTVSECRALGGNVIVEYGIPSSNGLSTKVPWGESVKVQVRAMCELPPNWDLVPIRGARATLRAILFLEGGGTRTTDSATVTTSSSGYASAYLYTGYYGAGEWVVDCYTSDASDCALGPLGSDALTVIRHQTELNLDCPDTVLVGQSFEISGFLWDQTDHRYAQYADSVEYTAFGHRGEEDLSGGRFTISLTAPNTPGYYNIRVNFQRDIRYEESSDSCTVYVSKLSSFIDAEDLVAYVEEPVTVEGYLKDPSGGLANKQLTLQVDGQSYQVATDSSGKFALQITAPPQEGTYDLVISWDGDSQHHGASKTIKLQVNKYDTEIELQHPDKAHVGDTITVEGIINYIVDGIKHALNAVLKLILGDEAYNVESGQQIQIQLTKRGKIDLAAVFEGDNKYKSCQVNNRYIEVWTRPQIKITSIKVKEG